MDNNIVDNPNNDYYDIWNKIKDLKISYVENI